MSPLLNGAGKRIGRFVRIAVVLVVFTGCATSEGADDASAAGESIEATDDQGDDEETNDEPRLDDYDPGSDDRGEDETPTHPDREDLTQLFDALSEALKESDVFELWEEADEAGDRPNVGVVPLRVHGDDRMLASQATTMVSKFETFLVQHAEVDVVSLRDQEELMEVVEEWEELDDALDYGGQIEPDYVVTGHLERRVREEADETVFRIELEVLDLEDVKRLFVASEEVVATP